MFTFPMLSLTADENRNRHIGGLLETEASSTFKQRRAFYEGLAGDATIDSRSLFTVDAAEREIYGALVNIFKMKISSLQGDMPEIDVWRVREKSKRVLGLMRKHISDVAHVIGPPTSFVEKLANATEWEENSVFSVSGDGSEDDRGDDMMAQLNSLILSRFSDIHHAIHGWARWAEMTLLCPARHAHYQGDDTHSNIQRVTVESAEMVLGSVRIACREMMDYVRLVNHL
ncbi:hypothetical protein HDV00_007720 [Rhizophlyctis rosea]|nr:hypothetical protein HDV00_007720 [Rhizophlyctis rosea]